MPAPIERVSVRSGSVRSLKEMNCGTDGRGTKSPRPVVRSGEAGTDRERMGTDGNGRTDLSLFPGANALARRQEINPAFAISKSE